MALTVCCIIAGIAVIVLSVFWLEFVGESDWRMGFEFLGFMLFMVGLFIGICLIAFPFMKNSPDETAKLTACQKAGGEYGVIRQEWNGKMYIDIYGCVQK